MKKIAAWLVSLSLAVVLCSCSDETICNSCHEKVPEDSLFCQYCGSPIADDDVEEDPEPVDYSEFNFNNMMGLTEFILIDAYDLSDEENPAFIVVDSWSAVITIQNGYVEERKFGKGFRGKLSENTSLKVFPYNVVSDTVIDINGNFKDPMEIQKIEMISGIPIIHATEYGPLLPTKFIDWSRSCSEEKVASRPNIEELPGGSSLSEDDDVFVYYIDDDYLS